MKKLFVAMLVVASLLALPTLAFGWGAVGHRLTGEAAGLRLPSAMPAFFREAWQQLGYLNPEPDRWRDRKERDLDPALDGGTAPEHFIDMEEVSPAVLTAALDAPDRFAYADTLRAAGVDVSKMGLLPFVILERTQELREDFRLWRAANDTTRPWIEARIIDDAGILGHYVADGSNPAHTTVQFNGWTGPNPHGYAIDKRFHSRFESIYVERHLTLADVVSRMDTIPRVLTDLRRNIDDYLRASNAEVERMYQIDKAHPFDANTTAPENKAFTADRLAAGARMLRDLWWTAWVTSG